METSNNSEMGGNKTPQHFEETQEIKDFLTFTSKDIINGYTKEQIKNANRRLSVSKGITAIKSALSKVISISK